MPGREVSRGAQSILDSVPDIEMELLQREVNEYLTRGDFGGATELINRHHSETMNKKEGRQKAKRDHEVSIVMHHTDVNVLSIVQNTASLSQPGNSSGSRGSTGNGFKREFTPNIDHRRFTIPAESGFIGANLQSVVVRHRRIQALLIQKMLARSR
jgi:hypothetical protein